MLPIHCPILQRLLLPYPLSSSCVASLFWQNAVLTRRLTVPGVIKVTTDLSRCGRSVVGWRGSGNGFPRGCKRTRNSLTANAAETRVGGSALSPEVQRHLHIDAGRKVVRHLKLVRPEDRTGSVPVNYCYLAVALELMCRRMRLQWLAHIPRVSMWLLYGDQKQTRISTPLLRWLKVKQFRIQRLGGHSGWPPLLSSIANIELKFCFIH